MKRRTFHQKVDAEILKIEETQEALRESIEQTKQLSDRRNQFSSRIGGPRRTSKSPAVLRGRCPRGRALGPISLILKRAAAPGARIMPADQLPTQRATSAATWLAA